MPSLNVKPPGSCKYDMIALGEIMLRLDPGEGRIRTTREFKVWEGGGEYNVARGLRRCFGLHTAVAPHSPIMKSVVSLKILFCKAASPRNLSNGRPSMASVAPSATD